jgi:hypothetical protein
MRGLFIDPAGKSKPKDRGYAILEWPELGAPDRVHARLLGWFSGGLPDARALQWGPLDVAVCEAQFPGQKAGKQSLITLGVGAGFLLGCAPAPNERKFFVPVYDWKNAIIPGFANARKEIFTNNLRQKWPQVDNTHCLDAAGMGFAFARGSFTEKQLKKWQYK